MEIGVEEHKAAVPRQRVSSSEGGHRTVWLETGACPLTHWTKGIGLSLWYNEKHRNRQVQV